uniref:Uncharacterized protein n=1 Tax=Anguilla anguilla TaxID=7936 RepID=A0A0E9S538_ANGAN
MCVEQIHILCALMAGSLQEFRKSMTSVRLQGIICLQYIHIDLMKSEILYSCQCSLFHAEDLLSTCF